MRNPAAAVSALVALTLVGPLVAQDPHVVKGPDLVATGKVISVGNTSIAIRTDDHGHTISFLVTTTTQMPSLLAVGSRVQVAYHAIGSAGQMADKVMLLEGPPAGMSPAVREFPPSADASPASRERARF